MKTKNLMKNLVTYTVAVIADPVLLILILLLSLASLALAMPGYVLYRLKELLETPHEWAACKTIRLTTWMDD